MLPFISIFVLFALVILARRLNAKAFRELSKDDQQKLFKEFKGIRLITTVNLLVLAMGYFLLLSTELDKTLLATVFASAFVGISVFRACWNHLQLTRLDLPSEYLRKYLVVQLISLFAVVGLIWFVITQPHTFDFL